MKLDDVTGQIIDAAIKVHTALGPGLMESAYEGCLIFELHRLVTEETLPDPSAAGRLRRRVAGLQSCSVLCHFAPLLPCSQAPPPINITPRMIKLKPATPTHGTRSARKSIDHSAIKIGAVPRAMG